ncbi:hypothetical protein ACRW9N_10945 [Listeria aquatica]|uniref:hypothetical protein n=1 Tax=Listeria aquatica TaxID=1494960 RepID=UPI003EFA9BEB
MKGKHISGQSVLLYLEEGRYVYQAEYGSGAAKDLEIAKNLAMLESFPPSNRQGALLDWTWKVIE